MNDFADILRKIKKKGLYPDVKTITGVASNPEIFINGKKYINFSSANYLGLANNNEITSAVVDGIKTYGLHPTGARLVSGTLDIHKRLEEETAKFKGSEDCMLFQTGTLANIGVIPAVINLPILSLVSALSKLTDKAAIFSDELNHASVIDGCRLAKAERIVFKHLDVSDLEKKLKNSRAKRKLIVTDGVFSMDGDIAPLPGIVELSKKYGALLMVDDAHATGVLGENGKGTLEYFGLKGGVDINMGTYSKAFGLVGGFITGTQELIDFLRVSARTYIFSGATFGAIAAGNLKALEIIKKDKKRREKLWENSDYLRKGLKEKGLDTLNSKDTPIIPVLVGEEEKAIAISKALFEKGIFVPEIRWPAVKTGESRIRITVIEPHKKEHLDQMIDIFGKLGEEYNILRKK